MGRPDPRVADRRPDYAVRTEQIQHRFRPDTCNRAPIQASRGIDSQRCQSGGGDEFKGVLLGDSILVSRDATEISRFEFAAFKLRRADGGRSADGGVDLGSILPPPREGKKWILDDPGDVQAATFAMNEAERRFHIRFEFPTALGDAEDVVVVVLGYQNADREPTIGSKVDVLGYARIRVP